MMILNKNKYMKVLYVLITLTLSSCSFVNEKNIEESEYIDVDTFLSTKTWEILNNSWTSSVEDLQINDEEILIEELSDEEKIIEETTEEDIKNLIDILFESSN